MPFGGSALFVAAAGFAPRDGAAGSRTLRSGSSVNLDFFILDLSFGNRALLTFPWH